MSTSDQHPNIQTTAGQEQLRLKGVKPLPAPDDLTRPYWEYARKHELRIQRCKACGQYTHPPQRQCPHCSASNMEWARISGKGVIYSFIVDHRLMVPGFHEPYVVAQVNPIEARADTVRITCNIVGCKPEDVAIGMQVEVTFQDVTSEITLPQFRPVRS